MEKINGLVKLDAMKKAFKTAYEGEANRENCAQETFHGVTSVLGIKNYQMFKSLSALEAGGAISTAGSCGAFSGGLIVISYFFGRTYEQWEKGKNYLKASTLGQKLYKKFMKQYGTVICREIHNKIYGRTFKLMDEVNLGVDRDELKIFLEMGAHDNMCPTVAGLSAMWTVEILWDELTNDIDISKMPSASEALKNFKPKNKK